MQGHGNQRFENCRFIDLPVRSQRQYQRADNYGRREGSGYHQGERPAAAIQCPRLCRAKLGNQTTRGRRCQTFRVEQLIQALSKRCQRRMDVNHPISFRCWLNSAVNSSADLVLELGGKRTFGSLSQKSEPDSASSRGPHVGLIAGNCLTPK